MSKGIYHRGYLAHWDFKGALQAITFRLADSVPARVIARWKQELEETSAADDPRQELHRRISHYEDLGHGSAVLAQADCASTLQSELLAGHGQRYRLLEWCIMPNHIHVMCQMNPRSSLSETVRGWKGRSAIQINRLLQRSGRLWQREYFDRYVRDQEHYHECRAYIRHNPVKAGLCARPEDWKWSSAGINWQPDRGLQSAPEPQPHEDAG